MDIEGVITEEDYQHLQEVPSFAVYFNQYQPITESDMVIQP